ncbi:MAG: hypothetical protein HPY71_10195 [Firmicutes bacterium]|nr:hypothetical protein [Bacillota bacterium]
MKLLKLILRVVCLLHNAIPLYSQSILSYALCYDHPIMLGKDTVEGDEVLPASLAEGDLTFYVDNTKPGAYLKLTISITNYLAVIIQMG